MNKTRADIGVIAVSFDQPTTLTSIRVEAESMNLGNYRIESNSSSASNGRLISFVGGANQETGTASFQFAGASDTYDVVIDYYDENDGAAQLEVKHDSTVLDSWVLDQERGSIYADSKTFTTKIVAKDLTVSSGDSFTLFGNEDQNEHARIDYIEFIPTLST